MLRNMKFGFLHITLAIVYLITEAITLYTKYSQDQSSQKKLQYGSDMDLLDPILSEEANAVDGHREREIHSTLEA